MDLPIETRLAQQAAQENCDGEPWDTMQEGADTIRGLRARVAELDAWQTKVCDLIQKASMDGQSILPHELTEIIYHD